MTQEANSASLKCIHSGRIPALHPNQSIFSLPSGCSHCMPNWFPSGLNLVWCFHIRTETGLAQTNLDITHLWCELKLAQPLSNWHHVSDLQLNRWSIGILCWRFTVPINRQNNYAITSGDVASINNCTNDTIIQNTTMYVCTVADSGRKRYKRTYIM